jgi:glutamate-1-semialdehyde aminotransferase
MFRELLSWFPAAGLFSAVRGTPTGTEAGRSAARLRRLTTQREAQPVGRATPELGNPS